jgi:serine O-acetyltransferase
LNAAGIQPQPPVAQGRHLVMSNLKTTESAAHDISADIPDWSREKPRSFWDPGRKLLLTIRGYQRWHKKDGFLAAWICKWLVARHRFWSAVSGAEIPINCQIGGGLLIPHPNGIVVHADARIGVNCLIFQQVTIGSRDGQGLPEIGGHVDIGAGAKILGAVRIGAHAKIGANSVVLTDVQAGAVAAGIPSRVVS